MKPILRYLLVVFFAMLWKVGANPSPSASPEQEFFTPEADKAALANSTATEDGLPKVLILGDSISIGYFPATRELLKAKASVSRPNNNCGDTPRGLREIDKWLGDTRWDVIHFNWGLWDISYRNNEIKGRPNGDKVNGKLSVTPETYEKNLNTMVDRLQKTGATLIWASTTIVPEGDPGRFVGDEVKYNAIAAKVMAERGIPIDDLHAASAALPPEMFIKPGDVHLTKEGYTRLAHHVAASISTALESRKTKSAN